MCVLGDGAVDVWDYNFVIVTPKVDVASATSRALVGCCHAENGFVGTFAKVPFGLLISQIEKTEKRKKFNFHLR